MDLTTDPTMHPSVSPTTASPTMVSNELLLSMNSVTLTVSFLYTLTDDSISTYDVDDILKNAANTFIQNNLAQSTNCDMNDYILDVDVTDGSSKEAIINATICFDCEDAVDKKLEIKYTQKELEKDFVDIVNDNIISIVSNSTIIAVEVHNYSDGHVVDDPTTTDCNANVIDNDGQKKNNFAENYPQDHCVQRQ